MYKAGKILCVAIMAVATAGPAWAQTSVQSRLGLNRSADLIMKINRAYGTQFAVPKPTGMTSSAGRSRLASASVAQ